MLNAALYLGEVTSAEWNDIKDGKRLISHRKKRGRIVRVAVLWPETIEALSKLPRIGERMFYSREAAPLSDSGAEKRFRKLREAAALATDISASHIRDGEYTAAVAAGVNE